MTDRPPIVFLPGVMGSRLYFPDSDKFWDPDSTWRMLRWAPLWPVRSNDDNRRELHAKEPAGVVIDPRDDDVDPDGVALGWGGVVWSFYGDYLRLLRDLAGGRRAFAVGYDWRQDIRWLGEYVADKFWAALDTTGASQLALVTHSMGGLVARAAFRHDPNLVPRISKVLYVCQPATGAVLIYRRLFTGLVPQLDGGRGISDRAFRLLLGNNRAAFVGNMSGQPGPLQLLPSKFFPTDSAGLAWNEALDADIAFRDLYGSQQSPPGLSDPTLDLPADALADFADRVLDVAEFHEWLGAAAAPEPAPPATWVVCGKGQPTEVRIAFPERCATPQVTDEGDGIVPILSALALGIREDRVFVVSELEHATACLDHRVMDQTRSVLSA